MKVHHIGYLVKSIEKATASFEALGYVETVPPAWDEVRSAFISFLTNDGYCVELIEPSKESDLRPLLKRYKNGPYHMCYECEDLEQAINELGKANYMMFREPEPAPAIGDRARVAFLMSPNAGMIELVEQ